MTPLSVTVTQVIQHPTSALEQHIFYEIEFLLADDRHMEMEVGLIKELQSLFEKMCPRRA